MAFLQEHLGETVAVAVAFIWAWGSMLFTAAGRRVGSTAVNFVRLPAAVVLLSLTHLILAGRLWPLEARGAPHLWLIASGVVGLAIGDSFLFYGFTAIGPRRTMVAYAVSPLFTAVTAWALLDERLGAPAWLGMALIIAGVMAANVGRDPGGGPFRDLPRGVFRRGVAAGLLGGACQGIGATCAKLGMTAMGPLPATLVRMTWGAAAMTAVILLGGRAAPLLGRFRDRRALAQVMGAVVLGPFVGVWLSLVAFRHADTGVAMALIGTVPLAVLLPSWVVYRDKPSLQALLGAVLAVIGGAVLFLR